MVCPRCNIITRYDYASDTHQCNCGRKWAGHTPDYSEIATRDPIAVVEVPQVERATKKKPGGKKKANQISMFAYGSRKEYLHRYKICEEEILTNEKGAEYWIKDNFSTGVSEQVFVPTRFKNAKNNNYY